MLTDLKNNVESESGTAYPPNSTVNEMEKYPEQILKNIFVIFTVKKIGFPKIHKKGIGKGKGKEKEKEKEK